MKVGCCTLMAVPLSRNRADGPVVTGNRESTSTTSEGSSPRGGHPEIGLLLSVAKSSVFTLTQSLVTSFCKLVEGISFLVAGDNG